MFLMFLSVVVAGPQSQGDSLDPKDTSTGNVCANEESLDPKDTSGHFTDLHQEESLDPKESSGI